MKQRFVVGLALASVAALGLLAGCAADRSRGQFSLKSSDSAQIIGGTPVSAQDPLAKHIVGLVNVKQGFICTGTVVSESLVITAAHCLEGHPSETIVIFGTEMSPDKAVARKIVNFQRSPTWDKLMEKLAAEAERAAETGEEPEQPQEEPKDVGDIAMLRFTGGLPTGWTPVPVLGRMDVLTEGTVVTLAGYGVSDGKTHEGSGTLRKVDVSIFSTKFSQTEILLDQTHGKGACFGDSGGPAFVNLNGQVMVWGVTSRGVNDKKGDCSQYAAYTNMIAHLPWLFNTARFLLDDRNLPPVQEFQRIAANGR